MVFLPSRVVAILLKKFGTPADESDATRAEKKMAGDLSRLLSDAEVMSVELEVEEDVVIGEEDHAVDTDWIDEQPTNESNPVTFSGGMEVSTERIMKAYNDYTNTDQGFRKLSSISKAHRFIKNKEDVRKMRMVGTSMVCNADQTGCVKEMLPPRCLEFRGARNVPRVAKSLQGMTHSSTFMPTLYANGKLGKKLLVVLQEPKGVFPKKGHFMADNLVVRAGSSHIMTKNHLLDWIENCLLIPESPQHVYLIVDSWTSFKDHASMQSVVPAGKKLTIRNIPAGATSQIQPLDVYFFRPFKNMLKRFVAVAYFNQ